CARGGNDAGSQRWLTAATHEVAETKASGKTPAGAKSVSYGLSVRHLSDTLAELGQYDKARAVAGHDVDAYERSNALRRYDFAERYGEQYLRSRVPAKPKKDWELGFAMEAASNLKKTWREVSSPDVSYRWLPLAAVAQSTGQLEEARAIRDWIRGQLEGDFSHKSRARELHGGLAGLELKAGNLDAAIEDLKRGAAPGFELSYLGPVGAAVIRKCLDEGRLDDALDVGNSLGWPIETLRTYRYIDNDRIIDRPPGGLPPHARLIEALAVRGDITLAKGVERATEKEAKDQFGNSALVSGLIRGRRDRELALARVREVAGHLPHEPEPPESTVNVNVAALLELAGGRPDAVRRLGAYVRSADQLKGVLAQLDHSKTLSLEERVRMTAALLEASDKNEWAAELAEREDPVRAAVAERHRGAKPDQVLGLQNRAVAQMRQNLERMEVFRRNAEIVDLEKMLEKGYTLAEMVRYPWLMRYDTYSTIAEKFPASAGTLTQERWIAENSYALMQGFDKGRIGRIVRQRLENGQETSLHDASQWLEGFKIPERRLDRAKYMATVAELGEGQVDLDECMVRLYAPEAEKMFLAAFWLQAGGTEKLPTNPRQYEQLFSEPVYAMVYQAMLEVRESGGSRDDVRKLVLGRYGTYKEAMKVGGTVQVPTTMEEYTRLVDSVFSYMSMADAGGLDARRTMLELKEMGKARREYIEETTSWLEASRNAPSQRLMRAWGDRDWALMDGVPDRAIDLKRWSKTNGLMQLVKKLERKEDSPHGKKGTLDLSSVSDKGTLFEGRLKVANDLTIEEIRGKYGKYLDELVVRYPAAEALWAIGWIKENLNTKADIPPVVIELEGGYVWEIIPKDDPRGFTIGYDTVCCMKIGGEGQSCMEAGYFDRRYAFATLYQPSGQLLSQAVAYHNPKVSADTLVLDNIELNQGRDQGD
ncbi:MAG TPA: hypothetical protein VLF67_03010, partial [Candidatus Saccharimonas sp.]|nr:hypothetical protein [Candidatus Saccharimonas sp.]